jgi:hypothetical protein
LPCRKCLGPGFTPAPKLGKTAANSNTRLMPAETGKRFVFIIVFPGSDIFFCSF